VGKTGGCDNQDGGGRDSRAISAADSDMVALAMTGGGFRNASWGREGVRAESLMREHI
jgi:hypothetical protein